MKQILVTTDFSEESEAAFTYVKQQADIFGKKTSQIHVLCVLEKFAPHKVGFGFGFGLVNIDMHGIIDKAYKTAQEKIKTTCRDHFSGYRSVPAVIRSEVDTPAAILDYIKTHGIELAVMASHGRTGVHRMIAGSVTEDVLRGSNCPVLVVPAEKAEESAGSSQSLRKHVIVTTDLSDESKQAYSSALEQVKPLKGEKPQLTLLHVSEDLARATYGVGLGIDLDQIRNDIEVQSMEELNRIREEHFPNVIADTVVLRTENAVFQELVDYAKSHHADMIVMASHGRSGLSHMLLGSVAERVLRMAKRPVLVVPVVKEE